ncbi:MAG TPA: hypothetical protein VEL28_06680 [Candidatus Binatia bacterium]|nr:hypothetical protein [Candidatus Binatia bacterium]
MSPAAASVLPPLAVFVLALVYLLLLRSYGFQLEDEGTLLFQFDRVLHGQQPYLDFHTGYTPGFFAIGTFVLRLFDSPVPGLRLVLALVNAASAACFCVMARRIAGPGLAAIPALLWLAFVPVYVGEFAAFNVPYPTWLVTLIWAVSALVLSSWANAPRLDKVVAAGTLAALALWIRPNSGAFLLAGSTWIVCALATRDTLLDRLAAMGATALMAFGIWYTFQFAWNGMDAAVHLLPVLAITVVSGGRESHLQGTTSASCAATLFVLAVSFVLPTLAWMSPLYTSLGHERFLFDVLLVGADYQSLYHRPHPAPEPYAVVVIAGCILFAVAGRVVAHRVLPAVLPAVLLLGALASLVWMSLTTGLAPEGTAAAISSQLENASYWLALTANFGALLYILFAPGLQPRRSARTRSFIVATFLAVAMYLQMFPRADFMHQITAAPLTMVVATALLARVVAWWGRGFWPGRIEGSAATLAAVWVVAAGVLAVELATDVAGPFHAWRHPGPQVAMPLTLPVHAEAKADDELEAIARVTEHLHANTQSNEPVWSFPATSALLYAAQRSNPLPHDYWFPGRPDHAEEQRMLAILRKEPPRYGVTLNSGWTFFEESPVYFAELRKFLVETYALEARFGRFDVMARRDLNPAGNARVAIADSAAAAAAVADGDPAGAATLLKEAIEPDMQARRLAARRWMQAMTPTQAIRATLPEDPADAVRLLRALRDGGDMRGAGWAMLGYRSQNPRIRREAVDAMIAMEGSLRMHRLRLANDFDPAMYRPFVEAWANFARELLPIPLLTPFAQAVLDLSAPPQPAG